VFKVVLVVLPPGTLLFAVRVEVEDFEASDEIAKRLLQCNLRIVRMHNKCRKTANKCGVNLPARAPWASRAHRGSGRPRIA